MSERLGIFGGTFDPIHNAHVVAALAARHSLRLDRVLMVVAGDPWQKRDRQLTPADVRLEMVRCACDGIDGLEASDLEVRRDGPTYTIDTVLHLAQPKRQIVVVLGADAARRLPTWHRIDELRSMVEIAVVSRSAGAAKTDGGVSRTSYVDGDGLLSVEIPKLDISSSDIRKRVADGVPIDGLVPTEVVHRIRANDLYTFERADRLQP